MAQIGKPQREIYVEPLELPVPKREETPAPLREVEQPEPEKVPA